MVKMMGYGLVDQFDQFDCHGVLDIGGRGVGGLGKVSE